MRSFIDRLMMYATYTGLLFVSVGAYSDDSSILDSPMRLIALILLQLYAAATFFPIDGGQKSSPKKVEAKANEH